MTDSVVYKTQHNAVQYISKWRHIAEIHASCYSHDNIYKHILVSNVKTIAKKATINQSIPFSAIETRVTKVNNF